MRQRIARLVKKTLSFSKKERESYWRYLAFYPPLQRILTYLALPTIYVWCFLINQLGLLYEPIPLRSKT